MEPEIEFEGKKYIPSKQAAEESGYTQDYVGQLARAEAIDARRVNGLWYVNLESVLNHKEGAEKYEPIPPTQTTFVSHGMDSVVMFDGKEYISSRRGASVTGYSQDYIGQLAREGKVVSRLVGNRWYVARKELLAHKKHNDALLAAVQAEATGLKKSEEAGSVSGESTAHLGADLKYYSESNDLMPKLKEKEEPELSVSKDTASQQEVSSGAHSVQSKEHTSHNISKHVVDTRKANTTPISGPIKKPAEKQPLREEKKAPFVEENVHVLDIPEQPELVHKGKSTKIPAVWIMAPIGTAFVLGAGFFFLQSFFFAPSSSRIGENSGYDLQQALSAGFVEEASIDSKDKNRVEKAMHATGLVAIGDSVGAFLDSVFSSKQEYVRKR